MLKNHIILCFLLSFAFLPAEIVVTSAESKITFLSESSGLILNTPISIFGGTVDAKVPGLQAFRQNPVFLNEGRIELGVISGVITGTFDARGLGALSLCAGENLCGDIGCSLKNITAMGDPVTLSGWVDVVEGISLDGPTTRLLMCIENRLSSDIRLNGGALSLQASVRMDRERMIYGPGIIFLNGCFVHLATGRTLVEESIVFSRAGGIVLEDSMKLSGRITFSSDVLSRKDFVIDGQGCDLDLSLGGTLYVAPGCHLTIEHLNIKGLGFGTILLADASSSVSFIGCTLALSTDYSFSTGTISFLGQDSTVMVGDKICYFTEQSCLVVDGVFLYYDPLSSVNTNGIQVADSATMVVSNGASVISVTKTFTDHALTIDRAYVVNSGRFNLTQDKKLFFRGLSANSLMLDGANLQFNFVMGSEVINTGLITIAAGKSATIRNVEINNFSPSCIELGADASLAFGDGVVLNFSRSVDLNYTLTIDGDVTMYGQGETVNLEDGGHIFVRSGSTLTVQGLAIKGLGNMQGRFILESDTSTIIFKDVTLSLSGDYDHKKGTCRFVGSDSTVVTGKNIFKFSDKALCVVDAVTVSYDPLSFPDAGNIQPRSHDGINMRFERDGVVRLVGDVRTQGNLLILFNHYQLQRDELISFKRPVSFSGGSDSCVVDGAGFSLMLPFSPEKTIIVPDGKSVVFTHVELKDFSWDALNLGKNATVSFGDGVVIKLARDLTWSKAVNFSGNVIFDLQGHELRFIPGILCQVAPGATITFRNGSFWRLSNESFPLVMSESSTLILQDMECSLSGDYSFMVGNLLFVGSTFIGTYKHNFSFLSSGVCTIKKQSSVSFFEGSRFLCAPIGSGRIVFEENSSVLVLNDATFATTGNGVSLDTGMIKLFGHCVLDGGREQESAGMLINDQTFDVQVDYKATLDVEGLVVNY